MAKDEALARIVESGVVAVMRAPSGEMLVDVAEALLAGGELLGTARILVLGEPHVFKEIASANNADEDAVVKHQHETLTTVHRESDHILYGLVRTDGNDFGIHEIGHRGLLEPMMTSRLHRAPIEYSPNLSILDNRKRADLVATQGFGRGPKSAIRFDGDDRPTHNFYGFFFGANFLMQERDKLFPHLIQ